MFPRPIATRDEGKVYRVITGASGRLLALVMDTLDGEIRLLDAAHLATRGKILLGAMRTVRACALSHDDRLLAAATDDDVTVFDVGAGRAWWKIALTGEEPAIAFSPDSELVAVSRAPGSIAVLRTIHGGEVMNLATRDEPCAIAWDRHGIAAVGARWLGIFDATGVMRATAEIGGPEDEARELVLVDRERVAVAGVTPGRVWLDLRSRTRAELIRTLPIDGDLRAEGLTFAGGVIFISTEGGTYRADPPFESLTRWLPPLGGAHDPTRLAAVGDGHVAVTARDLRVFRTRS